MSSADFVEEMVLEMLSDVPRGTYASRTRDFERDAHEYVARNTREPLDKRTVAQYIRESAAIQSHEALLSSAFAGDVEDNGSTQSTGGDAADEHSDDLTASLSDFDRRVYRVIERLHARIVDSIERRHYTSMVDGVVFIDIILEFDIDLYGAVADAIEHNFSEPRSTPTSTIDAQTPYAWFIREIARTNVTTLALFVFRCRSDPHPIVSPPSTSLA